MKVSVNECTAVRYSEYMAGIVEGVARQQQAWSGTRLVGGQLGYGIGGKKEQKGQIHLKP